MAGGGGAAKPAPTDTSRLAKTGIARATGAISICKAAAGKSAVIAAPAKAQGWCSTDLPFDGSSLCSLPDLSIQTVWVSIPAQMVSAKLRSADGIKPAGIMTRMASANTMNAAARLRISDNVRITQALCACDFGHARCYPFHARRSSATRRTSYAAWPA